MASIYRIYPTIGIARIGNSDKDFIGPESPSARVVGPFKEGGKIKKQGARFRIYEVEVDDAGQEEVIREVTNDGSTKISWGVALTNSKAASVKFPDGGPEVRNVGYDQNELVISTQAEISGNEVKSEKMRDTIKFIKNGTNEGEANVELGQLRTDGNGRLIVLGGGGDAKSLLGIDANNYANNDGWYDDLCDGPVNATVQIGDAAPVATESAWVVVASPAYAPEIKNTTTWYDQTKNLAARSPDGGMNVSTPSFTNDIFPILKRATLLRWVSPDAREGKGNDGKPNGKGHSKGMLGDFLNSPMLLQLADNSDNSKPFRGIVLGKLAKPDTSRGKMELPRRNAPKNMPYIYSGVNPENTSTYMAASVTEYQYAMMEKWAAGDFNADWNGEPAPVAFEDIPLQEQPQALIQAALEGCIGGPFFPGIESTYLMTLKDTYEKPYKIDASKSAGFLTEKMACPWQADFVACGANWWPAQRPVSVYVGSDPQNPDYADFDRDIFQGESSGYLSMVKHWSKLGFVVKDGDTYKEDKSEDI